MKNNNFDEVHPQNGVTFYFENYKCVDIDIESGIETVKFTGPGKSRQNRNTMEFALRGVFKQFPDVKKLIIGEDVYCLDISNFMFPNVRSVESLSVKYLTHGPYLAEQKPYNTLLKNVFCVKHYEDMPAALIDEIGDYAFEGCMSTADIFSRVNYNGCEEHAFSGSAYMLMPFKNGVKMIGNIIFDIDDDAEEIFLPSQPSKKYIAPENMSLKNVKRAVINDAANVLNLDVMPDIVSINKCSIDEMEKVLNHKNIHTFETPDDSASFTAIDGILYSKDKTHLIKCPRGKTGHVSIPEGVSSIGDYAFEECMISSVSFPSTLTKIGKYAFSDSAISDIDFGTGLEYIGINWRESYCFSDCNNLKHIDIPSQVTNIGFGVFSGCENLESVIFHDGLKSIGKSAFSGSFKLTEVSLPKTMEYLNNNSLANVEILKVHKLFTGILYALEPILSRSSSPIKTIIVNNESGNEDRYYIPVMIKPAALYKASICCKDGEMPKDLYKSASTTELKQEAAYYLYKNHLDESEELKKYIKRASKSIAMSMLEYSRYDNKHDDDLIEFLQMGLLSKNSLKQLLDLANKYEKTDIASYILTEIDKDKSGNKTFSL